MRIDSLGVLDADAAIRNGDAISSHVESFVQRIAHSKRRVFLLDQRHHLARMPPRVHMFALHCNKALTTAGSSRCANE